MEMHSCKELSSTYIHILNWQDGVDWGLIRRLLGITNFPFQTFLPSSYDCSSIILRSSAENMFIPCSNARISIGKDFFSSKLLSYRQPRSQLNQPCEDHPNHPQTRQLASPYNSP